MTHKLTEQQIERAIERAVSDLAPIFIERAWTWAGVGIPGRHELSDTLRMLVGNARRDAALHEPGFGTSATGRLLVIVREVEGRETLTLALDLGEVWG